MENLRLSSGLRFLLILIAVFLLATVGVAQTNKNGSKGFGIVANKQPSAKDVGLPVYPGAKLVERDADGDSSALFSLWAGDTKLKLVVLKLESQDPAEKIAVFYRKALGAYGTVLDCSGKNATAAKSDSKSDELTCDDDHSDSGVLLKAGTKNDKHLVGIEEEHGKRAIHLVYVLGRDEEDSI